MEKIKNTLYVSMIIIFTSVSAFSQTEVSGTIINGNWTTTNSPYIVVGDIWVVSLTIEPGVVIRFDGDYVFEVAGTLRAEGNELNPILFTKNSPDIRWKGIYLNASQNAILIYCRIEWSQNSGIRVRSSSATISFCRIIYNYSINGNIGTKNGSGIDVKENGKAKISNCVIDSNLVYALTNTTYGGAIYTDYSSEINLKNCIIAHNENTHYGTTYSAGIMSIGSVFIENSNIIDNDGYGLYSKGKKANVKNSIIFQNSEKSIEINSWMLTDSMDVSYSCIDQGCQGEGIISFNPLFADEKYNLLDIVSPCIDKGDPKLSYNDPEDQNNIGYALHPALGNTRNDMGAYGGPASFQLPYIKSIPTYINSHEDIFPSTFSLSQNYPNPFNPVTEIAYQIPFVQNVSLVIYDINGRQVRTLVNERKDAGYYTVLWNGKDNSGNVAPSGVYLYSFQTERFTKTGKAILIK